MIYLPNTTDKLQLITSSAATVKAIVSFVELVTASGAWVSAGRQVTAISSATTTDVLAAPSSSNFRTAKQMDFINTDASLNVDVTPQYNANATLYPFQKVTLQPQESLTYIEGIGWFVNRVNGPRSGMRNVSTADQSMTAASATYITGSAVALPSPVVAGMVLRWRVIYDKTGAGTSTSQLDIRFGTGGSTSDTSRCSTGALDTETAVADVMTADITATIRGPVGASCIVESNFVLNDNLTTTGFSNTARKSQNKRIQSAAFDITPAGTIAGLSMTAGTADVTTVRQCTSELLYTGG